MSASFHPKQLLTSVKWFALFSQDNKEDQKIPLICWALGEEITDDNFAAARMAIHGMISDQNGEIISAKLLSDFVRYECDLGAYETEAEVLN